MAGAGWYEDPVPGGSFGRRRWWDGASWTAQISDLPPPVGMPAQVDPWLRFGPRPVVSQVARSVPPFGVTNPNGLAGRATTATVLAGAGFAIAGGLLMGASAFLPWLTAHALVINVNRNAFQLGNRFGFSPDGLILIGLGVITITIGMARLARSTVPRYLQRSTIVTGLGALLIVFNREPPIHTVVRQLNKAGSGAVSASIGYGVWVACLAGAVAIIGGLILRAKSPA
jgi:hypothetical protein